MGLMAQLMLICGALALVVFAAATPTFDKGASRLGIGLMIAAAALAAGGLLGFLFGVPRADSSLLATEDGKPREARIRYKPNTNLEQISDWLTKIFVGFGLMQLQELPKLMDELAAALGPALGGGPTSGLFGVTLVIYFSTSGFLMVFLWTRVYLAGVLHAADGEGTQALARSIAALTVADDGGMPTERKHIIIRDLRHQLEHDLAKRTGGTEAARQRVQVLIEEYRKLRATPPGPDRTFKMSVIAAEIRSLARTAAPGSTHIRDLFQSSDGGRLAAIVILEVVTDKSCFDLVLQGISDSRSAFEQYHALLTAETLLSDLDEAARASLSSALQIQMTAGPGHYLIAENTDRFALAKRLVGRLQGQ